MRLADLLQFNSRLLLRQWFRTLMILLATGVGVCAVLLLTGLGEGARRFVLDEFSLLGNDVLIVLPGRKETTGGLPPLTGEGTRDLTLEDALAVSRLPGVQAVAPLVVGLTMVNSGGRQRELMVVGTSAQFFTIRGLQLQSGLGLPVMPLDQVAPVAIIGTEVRQELLSEGPVLGAWLRAGGYRLRVQGLLQEEGVSLGTDMRKAVLIPVASAMQLFDTQGLFRLFVQVQNPDLIPQVRERIEQLIQARHGGELDITLVTQDAVLGVFNKILNLLTLSVAFIAGISLIVAGILIMNITLISVSQRTKEIGLLKALGAADKEIHWLFLSEAILLALLGSLLGVVVGYLVLWIAHTLWPLFPVAVPFWALSGAVGVALGVAVLFAWLPASRAARLPPVQALRGDLQNAQR
ncbi:ABC transporter permease [Neptuniibacter sp. CAU 1671]|uniref:ABC transporter permease n=1 Tax=Neptuniibacter sp. CAU 1671 TaxID=3032593 RepID=UPI0023DAC47F|nr:ABC transporter permease [Neptuniibacter sp. CAU 1671]MDF2181700.1 ABC transporter permease [Neptuniibacter sp. CAU 1671]